MKDTLTLVWLRDDLRLDDHPAIGLGLKQSSKIIPVVTLDPKEELNQFQRPWKVASVKKLGVCLRKGDTAKILLNIAKKEGVVSLVWPEGRTPYERAFDKELEALCHQVNIEPIIAPNNHLIDPDDVLTQNQSPFKKYTPFANHVRKGLTKFTLIKKPSADQLKILPSDDVKEEGAKFAYWTPGEQGAQKRFREFLDTKCADYHNTRDLYPIDGTSMLSPHLKFGEISVRRVHNEISQLKNRGAEVFHSEILWREYAYYLFHHFPHMDKKPLDTKFDRFPWSDDKKLFDAWKGGMTGYPIIDAAMRELNQTGAMHNRLRMVVASFLSKHLKIHWREGERYFAQTLMDYDHCNNISGWQWSSGQGVDGAPYFRIFNPTLQSLKFDPEGEYIKRWVPELSKFDKKTIHEPEKEGLFSGGYPSPIVDHRKATQEAQAIFKNLSD